MKLALVVQRYGADISGGAELHARYVAEHLARYAEVEVFTTCARDYVTWRNELPAGLDQVNGVTVRRFPVRHERDPQLFATLSARVFLKTHSLADELAWLDSEGPASPALVRHVRSARQQHDYWVFFSYRYYHAYHGMREAIDRAVLVPTAERDLAIGLAIFRPVFQRARAIMYNSFEERDLIRAVSGSDQVPGVVVGVGSEIPSHPDPERFRQRYGVRERFALYVGRIDENKGCRELFDYFMAYAGVASNGLMLLLIGRSLLAVPDHPRIRHLGFVSDEDKFDALAAAEVLIMPSSLESLSMVALEAWALGRPVLANGRCDVLRGQAIRSNAGLYYDNYAEFAEALRAIEHSPSLARALGENGRAFYWRHYDWRVIERKYLDIFDRLSRETAAGSAPREAAWPLPGFWARRQKTIEAAEAVLARVPTGPSADTF